MGAITIPRAIRAGALISAAAVVANAMSADVPRRDHEGLAATSAASPALGDAFSDLPISLPIKWPGCRDRGSASVEPLADEIVEVQFALPAELRDESAVARELRLHATIASVQVKQNEALPPPGRVEQGRSRQAEIQLVVVTIRLTVDASEPEDDEPLAASPACGAIVETRL